MALCAGIGGLELSLRLVFGDRFFPVCHVERDSFAASVIHRNQELARLGGSKVDFAPIYDDLESFDGRPWRGRVDLLAAGVPCQPFSYAGSRKGKEDERWLGEDFIRVCSEVGPELIFLENVPGFLRHGLDRIAGGLAALGYDAEWGNFRADETCGAPHKRERFFFLAFRDRPGREALPDPSGDALRDESERGEGSAQASIGGDSESGDLGEDKVGHPTSARWEAPRHRPPLGSGVQPIPPGGAVADTDEGIGGRRTDQSQRGQKGRAVADRDGEALADPNFAGLEGRGVREPRRRKQRATGQGSGAVADPDGGAPPDWLERGRASAFFYTGGLVAVHAASRERGSIWEGLERRETYATSGPRILLWFDLLNPPSRPLRVGLDGSEQGAPAPGSSETRK